ncbi:hypothetical protein BLNAU_14331 [Blattamonas nauphoetae]|uniref:Uncharacterized protein n=1 Tax=Blattamonas nauphoetae TaxID=2049346 RepID=A0ABQ9XGX4_9EUKA|nr:hypothetical protein BLNAU_14331 [Blattamonas nauphoetae]
MLCSFGTAEMTAIEVDERMRSSDLFPRGLASNQQQRQDVQWTRKERLADVMRLIFLSLPLSPSARPISANSTIEAVPSELFRLPTFFHLILSPQIDLAPN